eukprot:gene8089-10958_t
MSRIVKSDSQTIKFEESPASLRKGKWTIEEENYANKIIYLFNHGLLAIGSGTTLRSYLSEKLNCDPMRITKKFAGAACIGKQVFQPSSTATSDEISEHESELKKLEHLFLLKLNAKGNNHGNAELLMRSNSITSPNDFVMDRYDTRRDRSNSTTKAEDYSSGSSDLKPVKRQSFDKKPESNKASYSIGAIYPPDDVHQVNGLRKIKRARSAPDLSKVANDEWNSSPTDVDPPVEYNQYSRFSKYRRGVVDGNMSLSKPSTMSDRISEHSNNNSSKSSSNNNSHGSLPVKGAGSPIYTSNNMIGTRRRMSKKFHSEMDLMDIEKLVSDVQAAGDFFFRFVNDVTDDGTGNNISPRLLRNTKENMTISAKIEELNTVNFSNPISFLDSSSGIVHNVSSMVLLVGELENNKPVDNEMSHQDEEANEANDLMANFFNTVKWNTDQHNIDDSILSYNNHNNSSSFKQNKEHESNNNKNLTNVTFAQDLHSSTIEEIIKQNNTIIKTSSNLPTYQSSFSNYSTTIDQQHSAIDVFNMMNNN